MKTIVFIFILSISLQADYLKANSNYCITDDWYFAYDDVKRKNTLYFYQSKTPTTLRKTTGTRQEQYLISGYNYDSVTGICKKSQNLGLTTEQYNFIYALIGLMFGYILFWLVPGSKK